MADTYTSRLRLRQQQTGANSNTWGNLLNTAMHQLIEDSLAGRVDITVAGADITLSTANGATDQARYMILHLQGSPGTTRSIICPAVSKLYVIENDTDAGQLVKTATGTGVTVQAGDVAWVMCDGTDVVSVQSTATNALQLGGVAAANYKRLDLFQKFTKGWGDEMEALADGATITLDAANSRFKHVTIAANRTIAITNPEDGAIIELYVTQDGTGGRTLTWPANIIWQGGAAPALSSAANATSKIRLRYNEAILSWYGDTILNFTTGGGSVVADVINSSNETDVNLFQRVGSPAGAVAVTLTIAIGALIYASIPTMPALDLRGFSAGSTVAIVNHGRIQGRGGEGGPGAAMANTFGEDGGGGRQGINGTGAYPGEDGGHAIMMDANVTVTIDNTDGFIWGGGGGGGGGGVSIDFNADDEAASGGGGGAGAGASRGGKGGRAAGADSGTTATQANANNGTNSTRADTSANGTGGTGAVAGSGAATAGTGGNGGDWGAAGSAGASPTTQDHDYAGGAAGGAGKAINLGGGVAPTFIAGGAAPHVKGAIS